MFVSGNHVFNNFGSAMGCSPDQCSEAVTTYFCDGAIAYGDVRDSVVFAPSFDVL